jgi:phenylalanyl-tRNA synthetase alpha chain
VTDAATEIESGLVAFGERFRESFAGCGDEPTLRQARAEVLGKKGELTALLKRMGEVPPDKRKAIGELVNRTKSAVEAAFEQSLAALLAAKRKADLEAPPYDLSLPGRLPAVRGHVHPLTRVKDEILDIFKSLGFEVAWGPEVELEANNFEKLAFPPDHPATDMQDTFWVDVDGGDKDARVLLRTHTSNVQVREMSSRKPPMAIVSGGPVYRRDDDVTHSPMFHQIEGFLVNERVSFAELKGVLTAFAERLYGTATPVRFRPSYFPFVEPGAEMDVGCVFCKPDESRASCRVCKGTGWLEILGCGMVHPDVFSHCGIDPERYTGFAFGLGVERVAMLRYQIPDIRLFFENDPRFLAQF